MGRQDEFVEPVPVSFSMPTSNGKTDSKEVLTLTLTDLNRNTPDPHFWIPVNLDLAIDANPTPDCVSF